MIWPDDISFEGFDKQCQEWYRDKGFELCDPPINAQFALDLIFKTLVDDKEKYPYLTTMSESTEQTNSIMLDIILSKYSRRYRRFKKKIWKKLEKRRKNQNTFVYCPRCHNEMVYNGRVVEEHDGIVKYCCSRCGEISFWDFGNYPVPYLRTCSDCGHLEFNNSGEAYCIMNCSPVTQELFDYKKGETNG